MSSSLALTPDIDTPVMRLSVPTRGHVLSTITELYGAPVRSAVQIVAAALKRKAATLPQGFEYKPAAGPELIVRRSHAEMLAWHLCTQWVVGVALGHLRLTDVLVDAAEWFASSSPLSLADVAALLSQLRQEEALEQLRLVADSAAFADLLPYLLDPHGPGSRLSVMRDPSTHAARARKRMHGVFYTPADVAEHMAFLALTNLPAEAHPIVFDPACGTGVFLRAALAVLQQNDSSVNAAKHAESLHGIDIDPWAVEAAAYVLLHDVLAAVTNELRPPASIWQSLRRNLSVADALSLDPSTATETRVDAKGHAQTGRRSITDLFPAMQQGPTVILGNPPYAPVGDRADLLELGQKFDTLPPVSATADMHSLFLEQMMRLAAPTASGALVLPLSIAFSSGQQYQSARRLIERTPGTWRFSFFDREPHALFGEDVKTRNAIVTWTREVSDTFPPRKLTGPLLKWRGHDRARMFRSIGYTEIHSSIIAGIPKLSSDIQAQTLELLTAKGASLSLLVASFYSTDLEQTFTAGTTTIFVGGTAYNFLNVFFRPPDRLQPRADIMSTNTVHGLSCARVRDAYAAYALLSSGTTFWLWHVLGDGFHVSRSFLEKLPLGSSLFTDEQLDQLATLGRDLWREVKTYPVASSNRGKASLSFPASRLPGQQRLIDQVIAVAVGLPKEFLGELDKFINSVVSAKPSGESDAVIQEGILIG